MKMSLAAGVAAGLLLTSGALAQVPASSPSPTPIQAAPCEHVPLASACAAVRGSRADGWLPQTRAEVMATHGIIATSQPLAAQAGLQVMRKGGNAIDAAVAAAAVLNVVEPMNVGLAGDLFAIVYSAKDKKLYVLDASGRAPSGATAQHFADLGYRADPANFGPGSGMPGHGILPVTVPGAAWGWEALLKRFGRFDFKTDLAAAEDYAEHGFPVSQRIAHDWVLPEALPLRACCTALDPDSVAVWYPGGHAPGAGEMFRNPDLAKTFRLLMSGGSDVFYRGEIARAIVAKSQTLGGTMTLADLADYRGVWREAAHTTYHGHDLYELPPPSQAWGALEMVNILEACVGVWAPGQSLASLGPRDARYWHFLVEAKKLAYADLFRFNADPDAGAPAPLQRLLSKAYARSLCGRVDPAHASATGPVRPDPAGGDTIVLSAADAEGNMVSWVNSNYDSFGSGVTVPGYGFVLHNRGALFSLDPASPNLIAPGKRPFNTLSAAFVMDGASPLLSLQLMGGDMQAQGHAQMFVNLFDLGANLQMSGDMARFRHSQVANELTLEPELAAAVGPALQAMGHRLATPGSSGVGGYQAVMVEPETAQGPVRVYRAASDPRKDGQAEGW